MAAVAATLFVQHGRKIVAVGRNYAQHAKELKNEVPESPVLFLKPTSSYITKGQSIRIPQGLRELHHEVELGVVIGKRCCGVTSQQAMDYVAGYALALDMTARSLQEIAKSKRLPWTVSKGYDTFTPVSDFIPKSQVRDPHDLELWLKVDGKERQRGNTTDMIFKVPYIVSYVSHIMTLEAGDLILTGTPAGVGPVLPGNVITAGITGLIEFSFPAEQSPVPEPPPPHSKL